MHERHYIERTIATVRHHRDADNCWPQWANIFADEIERLWVREAELTQKLAIARARLEDTGDWQGLDQVAEVSA